METDYKPGIVFRFRRPSSVPRRQPSRAMTEALRHLAESDEMRPFVADARAQRRDVVVEVFHSRDGHPLLIHIAAAPKQQTYTTDFTGGGKMRGHGRKLVPGNSVYQLSTSEEGGKASAQSRLA